MTPHAYTRMLELVTWCRSSRRMVTRHDGKIGHHLPDEAMRQLIQELSRTDTATLARLIAYLCLEVIQGEEQYCLAAGHHLPWPPEVESG